MLTPEERERILSVFDYTFDGLHHIKKSRLHEEPEYMRIVLNCADELATFDMDKLTRFVVACHVHCVRGSVEPSGPGMIKIVVYRRNLNTVSLYHRHPTIEDLINRLTDLKKWVSSEDFEKSKRQEAEMMVQANAVQPDQVDIQRLVAESVAKSFVLENQERAKEDKRFLDAMRNVEDDCQEKEKAEFHDYVQDMDEFED